MSREQVVEREVVAAAGCAHDVASLHIVSFTFRDSLRGSDADGVQCHEGTGPVWATELR